MTTKLPAAQEEPETAKKVADKLRHMADMIEQGKWWAIETTINTVPGFSAIPEVDVREPTGEMDIAIRVNPAREANWTKTGNSFQSASRAIPPLTDTD